MGSYTPTTWVAGTAPGISAAELNRIEAGVDQAHDEINANAADIASNDSDIADHETRISTLESGGPNPHSHANVTPTTDGFMDNVDKQKLDTIEYNAKGDQTITAGTDLTGGGTGDVVINHQDVSSQGSVGPLSGAAVFSQINLNGRGHVTYLLTRNLTAANIGAATSGHTHSAYVEKAVGVLSASDINLANNIRVIRTSGTHTFIHEDDNTVLYGDGVDEFYAAGVPYSAGAYEVRATESGVYRRLYYYAIASARRFKKRIRYTKPEGAGWRWLLGLRQRDFVYKSDPTGEPHRFYIAEELFDVAEAAGVDPEVYVTRDPDTGKLVNVDQRAMLSDVIEAIKDHDTRLAALEDRLA